jgi:hypothetical protein
VETVKCKDVSKYYGANQDELYMEYWTMSYSSRTRCTRGVYLEYMTRLTDRVLTQYTPNVKGFYRLP